MDVTLLGTMGWLPRDARETTCFAVREGPTLLVFDAGTGLRRLLDQILHPGPSFHSKHHSPFQRKDATMQ